MVTRVDVASDGVRWDRMTSAQGWSPRSRKALILSPRPARVKQLSLARSPGDLIQPPRGVYKNVVMLGAKPGIPVAKTRATRLLVAAVLFALHASSASAGTPWFEDVSVAAGVDADHDSTAFSVGQAWLDADRDGWLDLFVTNQSGPNHLFMNDRDGAFSEWPQFDTVAVPADVSNGVAIADVDNDGWPDIYVTCDGPNRLFRNLAGQGFVDIAPQLGLDQDDNSQVAAWADVNGDGVLDLYVVNYPASSSGHDRGADVIDAFYISQVGGGWIDQGPSMAFAELHKPGLAVAFFDFDLDGDQDLYVVNDKLWGNTLWRNDGPPSPGCGPGWCFTDVSAASNADREVFGMGIAIGDYDLDGDFDLYFSSIGEQVLLQSQVAQGSMTFVEQSDPSGLNFGEIGWATLFLDADNDGDEDAYIANYGTTPANADRFYVNDGGVFTDISTTSGISTLGRTQGAAQGDYDNDGRIDVATTDWNDQYRLFRNVRADDHGWVAFTLTGSPGMNRDAIGALIRIVDGSGRSQLRQVMSGGSRGAGNQVWAHFGLGNSELQTVEIQWPNGARFTLTGLEARRRHDLVFAELDSIMTSSFE